MEVLHSGATADLSVIIPTFNAKARAHHTVETLHTRFASTDLDVEILLVDDGSRLEERPDPAALPKGAHVVQIDRNRGKGHAVRAGLLASTGRRRIFTDVDLPYGTESILECYRALGDAHFVYGDRSLPESTVISHLRKRRRLSSAVFRVAVFAIAGLRQADTQCGLKGLRGDAAESILPMLRTDGFAFDVEIFRCIKDLGLLSKPIPVELANGDDSTVRLVRDSAAMLRDLMAIRARSVRGDYRRGLPVDGGIEERAATAVGV
jgi:dolichyl-phosphate beta-glucosyltransferase